MFPLKWFAALLAASAVEAGFGEHIKNTNNEVIIDDLKEAAACLGAWCRYNLIEAAARCSAYTRALSSTYGEFLPRGEKADRDSMQEARLTTC